ncbi:MAG: chloramphenicol acetyltransferase [Candidatus Bipolaricaulota bacterium]|nr:chloramphenicol acetyltransferase [Candidatus Bipolaricaulota bacterium]
MDEAERLRWINLKHWPRREAFELFRGFGFPYFNLTADVDVGPLREAVRARGATFTVALVYVLARAANEVPEFRQRMRGEGVIEHAAVHPSITVLGDDGTFRFVTLRYEEAFGPFAADAKLCIERARRAESLWSEPDRDDLLFMTAIPWVSFTGMIHPVPLDPPDSVPRIAWGKFRDVGGRLAMPLNVQAHHALIDGVHLGRYFEEVEQLLAASAKTLGTVA